MIQTARLQSIPYLETAVRVSVPALFERQVEARPEALACASDEGQLSYAALNARANQVAHALRAQGVGPEMRVGLYLERSLDFLVGLLGIFKAGGAYVPLDPSYPPSYLQQIMADAQPAVVVTNAALNGRLAESGLERLTLEAVTDQAQSNPPLVLRPEHLAHVNYTSGSTGRPKGAMVPHKQILNWLYAMWERTPFGPGEMVAQKTVAAFVVSLKELLAGLLCGTPLVLIPDRTVKDAPAFVEALQRWRVTRLNIVPSHLQALLSHMGADTQPLASLRYCIVAGEPLTQTLRAEVEAKLPWVELWNNYGCTELNDTTYCHPGEQDGRNVFVPIGRPIANTRIYVLDSYLRPAPLGVAGELCVESVGMARGYCQQPALTAERFIAHPFSDRRGARLYRTGDIVRYLENGTLDYLGRADFEVKIRGHRIDVRQVEKTLGEHPAVKQAVLRAWSKTGEAQQLVAYYVPSADTEKPATHVLRTYLSERLPAYMVPSLFMPLDALPRLANGKLNRLELPDPDVAALQTGEYLEPRTPQERILAAVFAQALGLERVGLDDNFFELGGHSLLAISTVKEMNKAARTKLELRDLFENPTVEKLAAIARQRRSRKTKLPPHPTEPSRRQSGPKAPRLSIRKLQSALNVDRETAQAALTSSGIELSTPSKILPFPQNPILRSYVNIAYPVGIITSDGSLPSVIYSNNIQLFLPLSKVNASGRMDHFRIFPGLGFDQYAALGHLDITVWDDAYIKKQSRTDLVLDIISAIDRGHYIFTWANLFLIPKTDAFLRWHQRHGLLITGYDSSKNHFIGVSYLSDGSFGLTAIPFMLLMEAIFSPEDRTPGKYNEFNVIKEIKRLSPPEDDIDGGLISAQIADYLKGDDNSSKYLGGEFSFTRKEKPASVSYSTYTEAENNTLGAFGIKTYAALRRYFESATQRREIIDLRATRVLMEHKEILAKCLAALESQRAFTTRDLLRKYREIRSLARLIHHTALLVNQRFESKDIERLLGLIDEVATREHALLSVAVGL